MSIARFRTMLVNQPLLAAKNLIPPLSPKLHKGQAGRVAVVGGSEESSAKSGDTLANEIVERVAELLPRIHALVVGPGLSRDPLLLKCSGMIIEKAKERDMPIVIDADGLLLIQKSPALIAGYQNAILTPNVNEFRRLCDATGVKMDDGANHQLARQLSQALGGVTIIQKGAQDVITNGEEVLVCEEAGGLKRCGGQGDILSGVLGAFMAWGVGYRRKIWSHEGALEAQQISLLAAYAGCSVTRRASKLAFQRYGRATVTERVLDFIQPSFTDLFERALENNRGMGSRSARIFVTVGSTGFDELIAQVLSPAFLHECVRLGYSELVVQYGASRAAFDAFQGSQGITVTGYAYKREVTSDMEAASLVISHAAVVNEDLMDNHQDELATALADDHVLIKATCSNLQSTLRDQRYNFLVPLEAPDQTALAGILHEELLVRRE
ncbi:hypothetical protein H4R33_004812 [Dimargaris cristalligena]|nr:hypothetical protein H4R33_004812 [Dimargaris cristalligena]